MILMGLMSCQSPSNGTYNTTSKIPTLNLEKGWVPPKDFPPFKMTIDNKEREVRCMTVEDTEKLRQYLNVLETLSNQK